MTMMMVDNSFFICCLCCVCENIIIVMKVIYWPENKLIWHISKYYQSIAASVCDDEHINDADDDD